MWAAHQAHHSSEDYNLTTALRQSVLQRYSSWVSRHLLPPPPPPPRKHETFNRCLDQH